MSKKNKPPPRLVVPLEADEIEDDVALLKPNSRGTGKGGKAKPEAESVPEPIVEDEGMSTHLNNDVCDSCQGGGDLLCCDGCPGAFHLDCAEPPLLSFPSGDWYCRECSAKKNPPKKRPTIFAPVLNVLAQENPRAFNLPPWLSNTNWDAPPDALDFKDLFVRTAGKRAKRERHEDDLNFKEDQPLNADFCFVCGGSGSGKLLLPCDLCARSYHPPCLDDPPASIPNGRGEWICPAHARVSSKAQQRAHDRKRKRLGVLAGRGERQFTSDVFRLDWTTPAQPARAGVRTAAAVSVCGVAPYHTQPHPAPTAEEQREFLISLEALQNTMEEEAASARGANAFDANFLKGKSQETQLGHLLQLQQKLLSEALPNPFGSANDDDSSEDLPPSSQFFNPAAVTKHLTPLFTQFLAWQRLTQVSAEMQRMQTRIVQQNGGVDTRAKDSLAVERRHEVEDEVMMLEPPKKKARSEVRSRTQSAARDSKPVLARLVGPGISYEMAKNEIMIGRGRDAVDGRKEEVVDVDMRRVTLPDCKGTRGISHLHASVTYTARKGFLLRCFGKNGATVGGVPISTNETIMMSSTKKTTLELGRVQLEFIPCVKGAE